MRHVTFLRDRADDVRRPTDRLPAVKGTVPRSIPSSVDLPGSGIF